MATYLRQLVGQSCRRISRRNSKRSFSSGKQGSQTGDGTDASILSVPLTVKPPIIPFPQYATVDKTQYEAHVTTLDNGLRVASQKKFGKFCTVGIVVDSGPRYEGNYISGVNHFLEKLAFSRTQEFADRDQIQQELEKIGGICDCQGARDVMIYAMSAETTGLATVFNILGEVVNRPVIEYYELETARQAIRFELDANKMNPVPDNTLQEMIFAAAYKNNTLGLPKICPKDNIDKIGIKSLYTYMNKYYDPRRMVLAGVGIDHDTLLEMVHKYFINKTPIWKEDTSLVEPVVAKDDEVALFTGGLVMEEADLSNVSLGPTPMPELAHFVIGLESCSHKDQDFVAYCVLNMLMGGGGSFSAGGPGKGMYSRLYLNVLNQYHWIESALAVNHAFEDTGMFCIQASANPSKLNDLVHVIVGELTSTSSSIKQNELDRAKTQLQSMLMMNLEQRPVVFEDLGRQVLSTGQRKQPQYYYDKIGAVQLSDIQRVLARLLKSEPAVAAYGTLKSLPSMDTIKSMLINDSRKMKRRLSLFGR